MRMKEKINYLYKRLLAAFVLLWALPALLVILTETGVFPQGGYVGDAQMEYMLQSAGILLVISLIPFSLRMFHLNLIKRVQELPLEEALTSYLRWSEIRLGLLLVPVLVNLSFYYLTLNTTGIFCAAMALLASFFCVPSKGRILDELNLQEGDWD